MKKTSCLLGCSLLSLAICFTPLVRGQGIPQGVVKGSALVHTPESALAVVQGAAVVLPASVTGAEMFVGSYRNAPNEARNRVPVVVFLHGSSGLGLKAINEWQRWLASLGVASFAPDSFGLAERVTYSSPVDKAVYEKMHTLRMSEIGMALQALQTAPWADSKRLILAGTSEGAVAVARYPGNEFAGKIIYSWSCENNYFVTSHASAWQAGQPVLNVMSSTDVYFSQSNSWLGNPAAKGHCADELKGNTKASVVLIPGAPHTLMNLPPARHATEGFVRDVLKP